jgi:hypothetical protein
MTTLARVDSIWPGGGGIVPGWLTEVLKLLGFTTPFVYAAATYGAFHWLDKKASGPAKKALTARLQSRPPTKETLANYALEVFDRIYSKPLWRGTAFLRSALITTAVSVIVWIELGFMSVGIEAWNTLFLSSLGINIFADYGSLFFIRKLLTATGRRPALGLIASFVTGGLIVYITFVLRGLAFLYLAFYGTDSLGEFLRILEGSLDLVFNPLGEGILKRQQELTVPAIAVHLWLPLFALAIGLAQASGWLFKAVGWMQWFLKQGQHHPFQAVGYVASVIVFVCAVIIEYGWH